MIKIKLITLNIGLVLKWVSYEGRFMENPTWSRDLLVLNLYAWCCSGEGMPFPSVAFAYMFWSERLFCILSVIHCQFDWGCYSRTPKSKYQRCRSKLQKSKYLRKCFTMNFWPEVVSEDFGHWQSSATSLKSWIRRPEQIRDLEGRHHTAGRRIRCQEPIDWNKTRYHSKHRFKLKKIAKTCVWTLIKIAIFFYTCTKGKTKHFIKKHSIQKEFKDIWPHIFGHVKLHYLWNIHCTYNCVWHHDHIMRSLLYFYLRLVSLKKIRIRSLFYFESWY